MKFLALLFLVACAHGTIREPARAGDRGAKLVHAVLPYASRLAWQRSPYWRLSDVGYPWNVVIATDGTACLLSSDDVFLPEPRDYWVCNESWRLAR